MLGDQPVPTRQHDLRHRASDLRITYRHDAKRNSEIGRKSENKASHIPRNNMTTMMSAIFDSDYNVTLSSNVSSYETFITVLQTTIIAAVSYTHLTLPTILRV